MTLFGETLTFGSALLLLLALGLALSFEFVNGFHDTANAVATVIYTHSLRPSVAVIWSGLWNLIGVLTSSGAVAFAVVALLPVELVLNVGSAAGFAMVFSLLTSAIIWNLGTWYFALPASSSHALIGSVLGVGLANSLLAGSHVFGEGVNWAKAYEVLASLLVSPVMGFVCAGAVLLLLKALIKDPKLYSQPDRDKPPPTWIRVILIVTCTGVSYAHGSNDGQKGIGLIMLILISVLPAGFALNPKTGADQVQELAEASRALDEHLGGHVSGVPLSSDEARIELSNFAKPNQAETPRTWLALSQTNEELRNQLPPQGALNGVAPELRAKLRSDIYLVDQALIRLTSSGGFSEPAATATVRRYKSALDASTHFIPWWVKAAVALALGLGTMIGWKRIVITVGEKIGKEHLTYAQGAAAELVAMTTIGIADGLGLPVSTTHVLSSGVAGTMAANHSGLNTATLKNLLLAWILTLPVCVFVGAALFALGLNIIAIFGLQ